MTRRACGRGGISAVVLLAACTGSVDVGELQMSASDDAGVGSSGAGASSGMADTGAGSTSQSADGTTAIGDDTTSAPADGTTGDDTGAPAACEMPVAPPPSFAACTVGDPVTVFDAGIVSYTVAWNGCEYGLLARLGDAGSCTPGQAQFVRLGADGAVLADPVDVTLVDSPGVEDQVESTPRLHPLDDGYLVTSSLSPDINLYDVYVTRIDPDGAVADDASVLFESVHTYTASHNRFGVAVAAADEVPDFPGPGQIRLRAFDRSGVPIGDEVAPVGIVSYYNGFSLSLGVMWDGTAYHVAYDDGTGMSYARVDADGEVVSTVPLLAQNTGSALFVSPPTIATNANGLVLIAYHDRQQQVRPIRVATVAGDGTLVANSYQTDAGLVATRPRVVEGPAENALVWISGQPVQGQDYVRQFVRFDASGVPIGDPVAFGDANAYPLCFNVESAIEPTPSGYGLFYGRDGELRHVAVTCEPGT